MFWIASLALGGLAWNGIDSFLGNAVGDAAIGTISAILGSIMAYCFITSLAFESSHQWLVSLQLPLMAGAMAMLITKLYFDREYGAMWAVAIAGPLGFFLAFEAAKWWASLSGGPYDSPHEVLTRPGILGHQFQSLTFAPSALAAAALAAFISGGIVYLRHGRLASRPRRR